MYKKIVFASMISALTVSASEQAFAMEGRDAMEEEEYPKFPSAQRTVAPDSDLINNIAEKIAGITTLPAHSLSQSDIKLLVDRFQEAIVRHMEYGFAPQFVEKIFDPDTMQKAKQTGMCIHLPEYEVKCFPLKILAAQPEEKPESSTVSADQERSLKRELIALFERHPAFQNYDWNFCDRFPHLNYESHFKTFFRFIEGMTEEQQAKTISLLSPHFTATNFGNFYPAIFIDGFTHNLAYIDGDRKIKWLSRKLEDAAYFPEPK
jgi:hypothetical protein